MFIAIDLLMMVLLLINLHLIIFEWVFESKAVQSSLLTHAAGFYHFYNENIHKDFLKIDMGFVAVFIVELLISWGVAIKQKTYHRWFFYPFVHWYDVLGCIPISYMRFIRLLRVISILIRLHKLGIIDLTESYLYKKGGKYLNILVEEVSDRVVVNVLEGIQEEIRKGNPLSDRIISEVLLPQKDVLVDWMSQRVQMVTANAQAAYREDFQHYIDRKVKTAVAKNKEIGLIDTLPIVGGVITSNIEKAICDIVFNVINSMVEDLASKNNRVLIGDLTDIALEEKQEVETVSDRNLNEIAKEIAVHSIDLIIEQVKIQQWKADELDEKEKELEEHIAQRLKNRGQ